MLKNKLFCFDKKMFFVKNLEVKLTVLDRNSTAVAEELRPTAIATVAEVFLQPKVLFVVFSVFSKMEAEM